MKYKPKRGDLYEQEGQRLYAVRPLTPEEIVKNKLQHGGHMVGETWWVRERGTSKLHAHFFGTAKLSDSDATMDLTEGIVLVERDGIPNLS